MLSRFKLSNHAQKGGGGRVFARASGYLAAGTTLCASVLASPALAAMPAAGSVIGNTATIEFTTASGSSFTIDSNKVETTVNMVAGVEISADQTQSGMPGYPTAPFTHRIVNTGNYPDSFLISMRDESSGITFPTGIFPDPSCSGAATGTEKLSNDTTTVIQPGDAYCIVIVPQLDNTMPEGTPGEFKVYAATTNTQAANYLPVGDPGNPDPVASPNDFVTDTVNVTRGAIFTYTKSAKRFSDPDGSLSYTPGDEVEFTLEWTNKGGATATMVTITDDLPAGLVYVPGSAYWAPFPDPSTPLTEASDGYETNRSPQDYQIDYSVTGTEVTAVISKVDVPTVGWLKFRARIADNASGVLTNIGKLSYAEQAPTEPELETNPATVPIDDRSAIDVTLADSEADPALAHTTDLPDDNIPLAGGLVSATDKQTDKANDEIMENGTFEELQPINFWVVLTNGSNTSQRFNLTAETGGTFPPDTIFRFFGEGGAEFQDNLGNDNIPDVLVSANSAKAIRVMAMLQPGRTRAAGDPVWEKFIKATSLTNPDVSNQTKLLFEGLVEPATVDIMNIVGGVEVADGPNLNQPDGTPWSVLDVNPGSTATFELVVHNTSARNDSYTLSYSNADPFAAGTVPAGWAVEFRDSLGQPANVFAIASGAKMEITAHVRVPAGEVAKSEDFYFRVRSASNPGVMDTKRDQVQVNEIVDMGISDERVATAPAGGQTIALPHMLTNHGNVAVTAGAIGHNPDYPTFIAQLFVDDNDNGVLDPAERVEVTDISEVLARAAHLRDTANNGTVNFDPGETVRLFSVVQVPANANVGASEKAKITVADQLTTVSSGTPVPDVDLRNNAVDETVSVTSGIIDPKKFQAIDADCDGTADAGGYVETALKANPGECILYRIVAKNIGGEPALNLIISDDVPNFTTLDSSSPAKAPRALTNGQPVATPPTAPANGASDGTVTSTHGTLNTGGTAELYFTVKIDQ